MNAVAKANIPFDINRREDPTKPGARLPTLGMRPTSPLDMQFPVQGIDDYLAALHASIGDAANLVKSNLTEAYKALNAPVPQALSYSSVSFIPDAGNHGLLQWPGMQPNSLRKISRETIAPQMIIRARVADLARYGGLSTHLWKPGWRIVMRDKAETPTEQDSKDMKAAENFIWNCSREGVFGDARERDAAAIPPFEMFLRSFADDALTFDGWALWTDTDARGGVRAFCNLPAGMIRMASPFRGYKGDPKLFAAMVDDTNAPVKAFTRDELTWRVRNVRLDPGVAGYGWPEIEMAIQLIQGFQDGIALNASTFSKSSIPNGMLLLKGDYFQQDQIDALMREWTNIQRGMSKVWGIPVMSVPEDGEVEILNFLDLKGQDVRYRDHLNMMAGICCLLWGFPVRRLGLFVSGKERDNQPVSDAAVEIQGADDPGLPTLLTHLEEGINPYLIWPNWRNLSFEFMNKNPKEDARSYEARKLARTWSEARAECDLPKLKTIVPTAYKKFAEVMELCPEDPAKVGAFQNLASIILEDELGLNDQQDTKSPGAPMGSKKDPAASQGHGHLSGTRRNSRAEKDKAALKVTTEAVV
jgi:hypothetical protein